MSLWRKVRQVIKLLYPIVLVVIDGIIIIRINKLIIRGNIMKNIKLLLVSLVLMASFNAKSANLGSDKATRLKGMLAEVDSYRGKPLTRGLEARLAECRRDAAELGVREDRAVAVRVQAVRNPHIVRASLCRKLEFAE